MWKDTTSWSRSDKDRTEPKAVTCQVAHVRLTVHRHIHYPGKWLASCSPEVLHSPMVLDATTLENAKREALRKLHKASSDILEAISLALKEET